MNFVNINCMGRFSLLFPDFSILALVPKQKYIIIILKDK